MGTKLSFPEKGANQTAIKKRIEELKSSDVDWKNGKAFSYVYYGGDKIADVAKECYLSFFSENALNPSAFPSLRKMEGEVVQMCADLFNGDEETAGTMTTGGTESILMAVKTARKWAETNKSIEGIPEIILPSTAHPAFHKACYYFGLKPITIQVKDDFTADVAAMSKAINKNTILLVGSAPSYPQGVQDDIPALGALAEKKGLLLHVDACIGGFMLPFIEALGEQPILPFDFRVSGVTSISADIHKYGFAAKGASVVLYKNDDLRKKQFYVYTDWTGGIYGSPSMTGTRSGGAIAAAWGVLNFVGKEGYIQIAKETMDVTNKIKATIREIEEIEILGNPCMTLIAIHADKLDIYDVGDELNVKGWFIDKQQDPPSLHLSINRVHTGSVDLFIKDLKEAVKKASQFSMPKFSKNLQLYGAKGLKKLLSKQQFDKLSKWISDNSEVGGKRQAAMYGMMGSLKQDGKLDDVILDFISKLNSLDD